MSPAGMETGGRSFRIAQRLANWIDASGLGIGFDSSTGFRLPNGAIRAPDASWLSQERWDALSAADRKRFGPVCPDFVIELRSRSDRLTDVRAKMEEYLEQGARLGWLIDPVRKRVLVYRPGRPAETLEKPAELSGEDVLPGFVLNLKGILDA